MASLWFGAGNNRNPLLWRRQVLYKIPNQSQPSTHGSSQQSLVDVWPGICTPLDRERRELGGGKLQRICCLLLTLSFLSESRTLSVSSCQTDETMPVRFDEELLIWVAAEQPLKDTSFLSNKILGLCGELPIYWLQPIYPKGWFLLFFLAIIDSLPSTKLVCCQRARSTQVIPNQGYLYFRGNPRGSWKDWSEAQLI